jgi:hypothetical protein
MMFDLTLICVVVGLILYLLFVVIYVYRWHTRFPYQVYGIRFMEFNANFNNISVISWPSVLFWLGEKPLTYRKSLTNFITWCCIDYTSTWNGFELTILVVIGTDGTCSCKSNYHIYTTSTTPDIHIKWWSCRFTVIWRVSLVEQELLTLPRHPRLPTSLGGFCFAQFLSLFLMLCGPLFAFSFLLPLLRNSNYIFFILNIFWLPI